MKQKRILANQSAILSACRDGNEQKVRDCLKMGDVNVFGAHKVTPLMEASSRGFVKITKALLDGGADVHAQTTAKETALAYAAANGHAKIVQLLISAGADPNCHVSIGAGKLSALTVAAGRGDIEIVRLLVVAGACVDGWKEQEKPAVLAAGNCHVEVVEYLLKNGVHPDAKGHQDKTVLSRFAACGSIKGVKLLFSMNAQINTADDNGLSPLSWACRNGHLEIAKVLYLHGADPLTKAAVNKYREKPGGSSEAFMFFRIETACPAQPSLSP